MSETFLQRIKRKYPFSRQSLKISIYVGLTVMIAFMIILFFAYNSAKTVISGMNPDAVEDIRVKLFKAFSMQFLWSLLLLIPVGALTYFLIGFHIIKRIVSLTQKYLKMANGDLTIRCKARRKDEVTDMKIATNKFLDSFQGLVINMIDNMGIIKEKSKNLLFEIESTERAVHEINSNITSAQGQMNDQSQNVKRTVEIVDDVAKNIDTLNLSIETQSSNIEESSSSIEEMIANIKAITNVTDNAKKIVDELKHYSTNGNSKLQDVISIIKGVSENSENLVEANDLITSIASQTNLLAMNAAIEAAHAGSEGKGFGVVADEIRKLAEMSTTQATNIKKNLTGIVESIDKVVNSSADTANAFDFIVGAVEDVIQIFSELNHAMEEQSGGTREILVALSSMKDQTSLVKTESEKMTEGNKTVLDVVSNLQSITDNVNLSMDKVKKEAERIVISISKITGMSEENTRSVEALINDANEYKIK